MINSDQVNLLLEKISLQNDESAFSKLFDLCFPDLMRFAYTFLKSHSLSEEAASDVLFNIWKNRANLKEVRDFRLYLYVSVRNKSFHYLRKKQTFKTISLEESGVWMKADTANPEEKLITSELHFKIKQAIQKLPKKCGLIYKLIKEDGLKYKEAAELLNLSQKTIEAQMGIAMKKLYNVFDNYNRDSPLKPIVKKTSK